MSAAPAAASLAFVPAPLSSLVRPCAARRAHHQTLPRRFSPSRGARVAVCPARARLAEPSPPRASASPQLLATGDTLSAAPLHRFLLAAFCAAAAALALKLAAHISAAPHLAAHAAAVLAAYVAADFATGVYHHAVDNYGDHNTPLFGYQIAAFQGHHRSPRTITARPVSNNLYRLTLCALPQQLLLLTCAPPGPPTTFYAAFVAAIVAAQEAHRQAHMPRVAPWVRALQRCGLIVPPRMHAAHHRGPHHACYCILSGVCNAPLDQSRFFRRLEALVFCATTVEPECWRLDPKLREEAIALLPKRWR